MKWRGNRMSTNVEDRRSSGGFGGRGMRLGGGGIGLGTIAIALVGGWLLGVNPLTLLGMLAGDPMSGAPVQQAPGQRSAADDEMSQFVSVVLADTEDVWQGIFQRRGDRYREPTLVLFRGATRTACGTGQAAMGPFYCPADQNVYIDLGFYETLRSQLGAPGDFAQAYVIAHEIGHHVQNLLGISGQVQQLRSRMSEAQSNALSVRTELQADCFAGVWAYHADRARGILEQGDIEEAMNAAARIGDDALQRRTQGQVVPDSFTHGTSRQRAGWFQRGLGSGDPQQCDTFNAATL
jgi:predicted metalloprotease